MTDYIPKYFKYLKKNADYILIHVDTIGLGFFFQKLFDNNEKINTTLFINKGYVSEKKYISPSYNIFYEVDKDILDALEYYLPKYMWKNDCNGSPVRSKNTVKDAVPMFDIMNIRHVKIGSPKPDPLPIGEELIFSTVYDFYAPYQEYKIILDIEPSNKLPQFIMKEISKNIYYNKIKSLLDQFYILDKTAYHINDDTIAKIFYKSYPNSFIYDQDCEIWYSIDKYGIFLDEGKKNNTCRKIMSNEFTDMINSHFYDLTKDFKTEKKLKHFSSIHKSLIRIIGTNRTKDSILKSLENLYGKRNIDHKFNNVNPYVIGFNNGVYDFIENKFRNARPEELISVTTKYDYTNYPNKDCIDRLNKIIDDIFPEAEEKEYMMKILSMCLIGNNLMESFFILIGIGANGKGVIANLMRETLGGYAGNLNANQITGKESIFDKSKPNPELFAARYKRIIFSDEISKNVELNESVIKRMSGGDPIETRNLFSGKMVTYHCQFKLFMLSNEVPSVDGNDLGMKRRLKYIRFRNVFTDKVEKPNHRLRDNWIKEDIKTDEYRLAFFHILKEYINKVKVNRSIDGKNIIIPKTIQNETDNYLDDNNPVKEFFNNSIKITENQTDYIRSSDLYKSYIDFHDGTNMGIDARKFKDILTTRMDIHCKRMNIGVVYIGIKFSENNNIVEI